MCRRPAPSLLFAFGLFVRLPCVPASSWSSEGTSCNTTMYESWYESSYSGALIEDLTDFWLFSDAELTNGQALEVVSSTCLVMMSTLRLDRAGRNGPVPDKYIYDVMCADECVLSDSLREEAMAFTGCTCLQLSSQPADLTYHLLGDWCRKNSGRYCSPTYSTTCWRSVFPSRAHVCVSCVLCVAYSLLSALVVAGFMHFQRKTVAAW